jgi:hypothetical protein
MDLALILMLIIKTMAIFVSGLTGRVRGCHDDRRAGEALQPRQTRGIAHSDGRPLMGDATDGTGAGLLDFLDWAGKRGELPVATAKNLAVATGKVLAIEPDLGTVDVKQVDPEDIFGRFETLNRTGYTTQSMNAYRSRFYKAVSMYRAWLDKRPDWKAANLHPPTKAVAVRFSGNGKPVSKSRSKRQAEAPPGPASDATADQPPHLMSAAMVPYDLPLRPGLRVRLVLPEILTQADAKRITAFVTSLAFDQAEIPEEGA